MHTPVATLLRRKVLGTYLQVPHTDHVIMLPTPRHPPKQLSASAPCCCPDARAPLFFYFKLAHEPNEPGRENRAERKEGRVIASEALLASLWCKVERLVHLASSALRCSRWFCVLFPARLRDGSPNQHPLFSRVPDHDHRHRRHARSSQGKRSRSIGLHIGRTRYRRQQ